MIKQVKFISIPMQDQNRALEFYTDNGWTLHVSNVSLSLTRAFWSWFPGP